MLVAHDLLLMNNVKNRFKMEIFIEEVNRNNLRKKALNTYGRKIKAKDTNIFSINVILFS